MCGRYVFTSAAEAVRQLFDLPLPGAAADRYNIAPGQFALVRRQGGIAEARWGLVPGWARDESFAYRAVNARSETLAEKPAFRDAFAKRRCLIPATAFYEWLGEKAPKQAHLLYDESGAPLVFAGLWERWEKGEAPLETFTIVTTAADPKIRWLHERMPVCVAPEAFDGWVEGSADDAAAIMAAPKPVPWAWHKVSPAVNSVKNDAPALIEPWEPAQGSLF